MNTWSIWLQCADSGIWLLYLPETSNHDCWQQSVHVEYKPPTSHCHCNVVVSDTDLPESPLALAATRMPVQYARLRTATSIQRHCILPLTHDAYTQTRDHTHTHTHRCTLTLVLSHSLSLLLSMLHSHRFTLALAFTLVLTRTYLMRWRSGNKFLRTTLTRHSIWAAYAIRQNKVHS